MGGVEFLSQRDLRLKRAERVVALDAGGLIGLIAIVLVIAAGEAELRHFGHVPIKLSEARVGCVVVMFVAVDDSRLPRQVERVCDGEQITVRRQIIAAHDIAQRLVGI